jgi:hypothetical protein
MKSARALRTKKYNKAHDIDGDLVYLIKAANGLFKIGRTNAIRFRMAELRVASPIRLTLHSYAAVRRTRLVERYLHAKFKACRLHGEWFKLSESQLIEAQHSLMKCADSSSQS